MAAGASSVIRQRPRQAENVIGAKRKGLDVHSTEWTGVGSHDGRDKEVEGTNGQKKARN